MEDKVNYDPKTITESTVVTRKMENAKKEGITKGALTAGIISIILLMLLGVLFYSFIKRRIMLSLPLWKIRR